jgi:hypothetical protein
LLHRLGGQPSAQFPAQIEFRFGQCLPTEMPDATVVVDSEGIYFVDSCGDRQQVAVLFRKIIDEALTFSDSSDSVVITGL